jgi:hypothetical protein
MWSDRLYPLIPAKVVTQLAVFKGGFDRLSAQSGSHSSHSIWVPALAGMSGV